MESHEKPPWFAVRHVIWNLNNYEERITIWQASSHDEAIAAARAEAAESATYLHDGQPTDLFQSYELLEPPGHGKEVFSLIRYSDLQPDEYIDHFFDTGAEHQSTRTSTD